MPKMQEAPKKPVYEQTLNQKYEILNEINNSLQWDKLEDANNETSFYGL